MKKYVFLLMISFLIGIAMPLTTTATAIHDENISTITDGNSVIYGTYKAKDDEWSCVITLKSNGSFTMVEREGNEVEPTVYGTFKISGQLERGYTVDIYLYIDGSLQSQGTLAWALEDGLLIMLEGEVFYKM